ncbi:MAG: prolipoprotein diacylglyceryl transferase [Terriglobales bacterium]
MFPVLFHGGWFTLHTYGLLVAIGYLTGIFVATHAAKRLGQNPDQIFNLAVYLAIGAIVGAKLFLVLQDWRFYVHEPRALLSTDFLESGGIFYGGLIVALLVLVWFVRHHRLSWLAVGDAVVPGLALGHGIGRMGCYSAGCCWGKPSTITWFSTTFTRPYAHATVGVPLNVPLWPTELMMAAAGVVIFILLWRMVGRRRYVGELTAFYLFVYGGWRYTIDFFRYYSPQAQLFHGLMTDAQLTSLCMMVLAIGIWIWQRGQSQRAAAPAAGLRAGRPQVAAER